MYLQQPVQPPYQPPSPSRHQHHHRREHPASPDITAAAAAVSLYALGRRSHDLYHSSRSTTSESHDLGAKVLVASLNRKCGLCRRCLNKQVFLPLDEAVERHLSPYPGRAETLLGSAR